MCSVLMSIKPEYVQGIMSGRKIYEFRKKTFKRAVNRIYIYSTVPVKKIVGEAEIESVIVDTPEELWRITHSGAGINKDFFDRYFEDRKEAVAYKLVNIKKYKEPKNLSEMGIKTAPQSYQYVEEQ